MPAVLLLVLTASLPARTAPPQAGPRPPQRPAPPREAPADLKPLLTPAQSEMRLVADRYAADRDELSRFYRLASPVRFGRLKRFDLDWQAALAAIKPASLKASARKDLEALQETVQVNLRQLEAEAAAAARIGPLVPFAPAVTGLEEARMRMETLDARKAAVILSGAVDHAAETRAKLESLKDGPGLADIAPGRDVVLRAADAVKVLRAALKSWHGFYHEYDPLFDWWLAQPYGQADKAFDEYETFLRDTLAPAVAAEKAPAPTAAPIEPAAAPPFSQVPDLARLIAFPQDEMRGVVERFRGGRGFGGPGGPGGAAAPDKAYLSAWLTALKKLDFRKLGRPAQIDYLYLRNSLEVQLRRAELPTRPDVPRKPDDSGIAGQPIGREALLLGLAEELIPYTPEELIAEADRQFAWCEAEMKATAAEMGLGGDWKAAVEKVKTMHAEPGGQPAVVRDLILGAVDYLREKDLITVPEIEKETLRMEMMSARRQLVTPFFTGGALISVSFPTSAMTTGQKLESLRGNNIPFSHATAFHEMIPGHNMQNFMSRRFRGLVSDLGTSFWLEGWPVYWETLLYDLGFDATPEERVGALFWRMHRCARIVFSLRFHLGDWSPQECIDYLVETVGHERENATAEVRRSFAGGYGPLYQAAYLVGALQMRALKAELVDSGRMSLKDFHDAVVERGSLPIALLRLWLGGGKLRADMPLDWKFLGPGTAAGDRPAGAWGAGGRRGVLLTGLDRDEERGDEQVAVRSQ